MIVEPLVPVCCDGKDVLVYGYIYYMYNVESIKMENSIAQCNITQYDIIQYSTITQYCTN